MIEIRLIRNGTERHNREHDDVIVIRARHNRDDFLTRYSDGTAPRTVWVQERTLIEVVEYVRAVIYFSMMDADPFYAVQLTIPGYPIIYIGCSYLTESIIEDLVRTVEISLENPAPSFRLNDPTLDNVA